MEKGWRNLVLGAVGLTAMGAVLLASGFPAPAPKQAVYGQELPPAHTAPASAAAAAAAPAPGPGREAAKNPEEGFSSLLQELRASPANGAGWGELGLLAMQLRRYPVAADAFATALETEPLNLEYRTGYANALLFLGMARSAIREYRTLVQQQPENPVAHMNLGVALSHGSPPDIDGAVKEWNEVVRLAPGEPVAAKAQEYLASYRRP
ncbi:MAG: tetratricopeptide repeat protein [Chloroflexi bacterium]|nr:tetratricopeptide repeat protein [Chloroflexota bacterium]